jgi:hypothetical protein
MVQVTGGWADGWMDGWGCGEEASSEKRSAQAEQARRASSSRVAPAPPPPPPRPRSKARPARAPFFLQRREGGIGLAHHERHPAAATTAQPHAAADAASRASACRARERDWRPSLCCGCGLAVAVQRCCSPWLLSCAWTKRDRRRVAWLRPEGQRPRTPEADTARTRAPRCAYSGLALLLQRPRAIACC